MKNIIILALSTCLFACQPIQTKDELEYAFVCKSLINGYLNAQRITEFELQDESFIKDQLIYTYKKQNVSGMVLGIPQPPELLFACSKQMNRYQLSLINHDKTQLNILQFSESP